MDGGRKNLHVGWGSARGRALSVQAIRQGAGAGERIGMVGAERLLADRQRPLEERPRRRKIALRLQQGGEVVEALRGIGMVGAERPLADRQGALEERPRRRKIALRSEQEGEVV
jgi:hypothetical protein